MQLLDAVVSHRNVQKPLGNGKPWTQKLLSCGCKGDIRVFKAALETAFYAL